MPKPSHFQPADLRGLSRLSIEAVSGVTGLVESLHRTIARPPLLFGRSGSGRTGGITGLVYRSIGGVTSLVGGSLEVAFGSAERLLGERSSTPEREAALAVVNGVLGDHLAETGNPLAVAMSLRRDGQPIRLERAALAEAIDNPCGRLMVMVHGLCLSDRSWHRGGPGPATHENPESSAAPESLARELGCTPVYLNYNSGRHISTNGREFAALLEALVEQWPVPVEELVIIGHSMGGLVTRSACRQAAQAGHGWLEHLKRIVFLGTPHHGAPLEQVGNWVDSLFGVSAYSAPFARLGRIRSAGVTDLRYGNLLDQDWQGRDRFERTGDHRRPVPLPEGVVCYAIAAISSKDPEALTGRLLGDGLVPVASALGQHADPTLQLPIPDSHRHIACETGHLSLLNAPSVHRQLRRWLSA